MTKRKKDANGNIYPMTVRAHAEISARATCPAEMPCYKRDGSPYKQSKEERFLNKQLQVERYKDPAAREKISRKMTGRVVSAETRAKISAIHRGKKISAEARAKMSKAKKGKPIHSEATKQKLRERMLGDKNPFYGKKHSAESRAKISKAGIGRPVSDKRRKQLSRDMKGEGNPFYGRNHTDESKEKMAAAATGKKASAAARAKMSKAHKGRKHTAQARANMSAAQQNRKTKRGINLKNAYNYIAVGLTRKQEVKSGETEDILDRTNRLRTEGYKGKKYRIVEACETTNTGLIESVVHARLGQFEWPEEGYTFDQDLRQASVDEMERLARHGKVKARLGEATTNWDYEDVKEVITRTAFEIDGLEPIWFLVEDEEKVFNQARQQRRA